MTSYGVQWSKHRYYKRDPLPEVKPALLNSLDIKRYVDKGCLLETNHFEHERMKPASYELKLLGTLYWWEEVEGQLELRCRNIRHGDPVKLSRNSISYLWAEEPLRLPEYIAARFNLRIREVHKGILLGTGPLVDPGFGGRILIPLHNLTNNNYFLEGGKGIIWVEFTKVSLNPYWKKDGAATQRPDELVEFPAHKVIENPGAYLEKAGAMIGVQSAFRGALDGARTGADAAKASAAEARDQLAQFESRTRNFTIIGGVSLFVGIAALILSALQISVRVVERVHVQDERIGKLERVVRRIEDKGNEGPTVGEPNAVILTEEIDSNEGFSVNGEQIRDGSEHSSSAEMRGPDPH